MNENNDELQDLDTLKAQIKALQEELENERQNNVEKASSEISTDPVHKSIGKPPVKKLIVSSKK